MAAPRREGNIKRDASYGATIAITPSAFYLLTIRVPPFALGRLNAWRSAMKSFPRNRLTLALVASLLTGCAVGVAPQNGTHLSPTECRDLAALRTNAPPTMAQHQSELAALRKAGYDPSPWYDDPYYPDDIQAAQRLVDYWFQTECQRPQAG